MADDIDGSRPQDAGRKRTRKGSPSRETRSLLADYQSAMRGELRELLTELAGTPVAPGLLDDPGTVRVSRPPVADRAKLWDLAIRLGRELGSEVDPTPDPAAMPVVVGPGRRRRARIDYG